MDIPPQQASIVEVPKPHLAISPCKACIEQCTPLILGLEVHAEKRAQATWIYDHLCSTSNTINQENMLAPNQGHSVPTRKQTKHRKSARRWPHERESIIEVRLCLLYSAQQHFSTYANPKWEAALLDPASAFPAQICRYMELQQR